jgi:hypothetical protein
MGTWKLRNLEHVIDYGGQYIDYYNVVNEKEFLHPELLLIRQS